MTISTSQHPLEPLTAEEITAAVRILRAEKNLSEFYRFASVNLHEPSKELVLRYTPGDSTKREAFCIVLNYKENQTFEAVVSLSDNKVTSWKHVPGMQPGILMEEFEACQRIVKEHPEMQEAFRRRGIEDFTRVMVDPWSAGNFGIEEEVGVRAVRAICYYKTSDYDNGYARPLSGLYAIFDLNRLEVMKVVDKGAVPLPPLDGNYTPDKVGPLRTDLKPLEIIQPEGPSFTIGGHEISWQKWKIRFGFTSREGLVLHTVSYLDKGEQRPILYRASLSEMVVPYGDPTDPVNRNNAFDAGEYGIGALANSLELGCDCLGEIRYFNANLVDGEGNAVVIKNAVCLHEEDFGILWKHTDWRTGQVEVRRSRRLVLSSISTVGNYEYGFFWYFYQDGTIQFEVKLTGILHTQALQPGERVPYGNLIAPQLVAAHHQHFFNVRMDMMIDGVNNSIYEVNTSSMPPGPDNPYENGFIPVSTQLKTETEAVRDMDIRSSRYWKIVNPNKKNHVGDPVSYKLFPGENAFPFASDNSSLIKRAGFLKHHLWCTPYNPEEKYASGSYPNQHAGGAGLSSWVQQDRSLDNTDVVVWYTMGHHHVTRPEDWPVMPTAYIGFSLKPVGFFDRSPALDVPPSKPKHGSSCHSDHGPGCGSRK
ncbi:primary-amine oxidase [Paenibacillus forsythiae]|uniref:Amine oxidase n=1 Tax=Paenibacillus forsythiae TaxID=365616 RepID=A0ABU3H5Q9_9BACL|nr:primary-amine oxidase [Paenibacillus forsythiae]MDT3425806.1 primary-amine oxidase [Paenibacillus forsythiae]